MMTEDTKKVLIYSGVPGYEKLEVCYGKAFREIGYQPLYLMEDSKKRKETFRELGEEQILFFSSYKGRIVEEELIDLFHSLVRGQKRLLQQNMVYAGVSIGQIASSTIIRKRRLSSLDLNDETIYQEFRQLFFESLRYVVTIQHLLEEVQPDLVFTSERCYSPIGELYDVALSKKIPVISRNASQRDNYEILKRYDTKEDTRSHYHSLSEESWQYIQEQEWTEEKEKELYDHLKGLYVSGEWFSEVGTQFHKKLYSKEEICKKLGIQTNKEIAIVFPHLFWDATSFWGEDLFVSYQEWFEEVIKVAKENDQVEWIIKVHPSNVVKMKREGLDEPYQELQSIKKIFGDDLPSHLHIIEPESDLNTFSLFEVMDYCLTVRGTIGIESAAFGKKVILAGTGRYDHLGFTADFESRENYLDFIKHLPSSSKTFHPNKELAKKFAYAIFLERPLHIDVMKYCFQKDETASLLLENNYASQEEFLTSEFFRGFSEFILSKKKDYLKSLVNQKEEVSCAS